MPKYVYYCEECDNQFEVVHGMMEKQESCDLCSKTSCLRRIPQMINIKTFEPNQTEKQAVGSHVKQAIEENSKILKEMQQQVKSQEYKDDN